MEELFDNRLIRLAIGLLVLGGGGWAVAAWVHRLGARADSKGERDVAKAIAKGDRVGAARIAMDNELYTRAAEIYDGMGRKADAGRALRKAEKWDRAAHAFEQAEDWDSAAYCYRKLGDARNLQRALTRAGAFREAAELAADNSHHAEAGELLVKAGDKAAAVEMFAKAGDKERALALSAEVREEQGDYEGAGRAWVKLEQWDRAADCFLRGDHFLLAAKVYVRLGRPLEGAEVMARAGQHGEAAALYEQGQQFRRAAAQWQRAGEPERAIGALLREGDKLAVIKLRLAKGEDDQALAVIAGVAETEAAFPEAMRVAAGLYRQRGDDRSALRALSRLLETPLAPELRIEATREAVELAITLGQGRIGKALLERVSAELRAMPVEPTWVADLRAQLAEIADAPEEMDLVARAPRPAGRVQLTRAVETEATQSYGEGTEAYVGGVARPTSPAEFGVEIDDQGWPKGVPPSLARRYQGLERLGQGGNGVVFRANDSLLGRTVVLKFMIDGSMPTEMARKYFEREIKMAASLSHPNIVHIYDMGHEGDVPWYSMEYVEGRPLSSYMPPGKPIADKVFLMSVAEQICAALDHAHSRAMVHRDIKPDNILVAHDGAVKLLDFGLAKVLDDSFGELSVLAGTPYYMAPEQIDGSIVDHRADIYAFGIILYRAFTGRLPFQDGNIFVAHALEPVPDPRKYNPDLSDAIVALLHQVLSKKPSDRPDNCGSIKVALHDALFGHLRAGVSNT